MIRNRPVLLLVAVVVCASSIVAARSEANQQTVGDDNPQTFTLYPPRDQLTGKYDESRACFSFKLSTNKLSNSNDWDLGYGFVTISNQDWLSVGASQRDKRSVIKGLGSHNWSDSLNVPVLPALPRLVEGESRQVTIDASADTHAAWANSTTHFAEAKVGHMYVMHVTDDQADFYVLFRIDQLEQRKQCTISWKRIATPEVQGQL